MATTDKIIYNFIVRSLQKCYEEMKPTFRSLIFINIPSFPCRTQNANGTSTHSSTRGLTPFMFATTMISSASTSRTPLQDLKKKLLDIRRRRAVAVAEEIGVNTSDLANDDAYTDDEPTRPPLVRPTAIPNLLTCHAPK